MESQTAERDGISGLPEPILHHILSFLSQDREVVRTSVLSKSWRHLVSTRPKFSLENYFGDEEKFKKVFEKSLQVYYDQKLSVEDFRVRTSMFDPVLVPLLEKWIPILIQDIGVKKLSLTCLGTSAYFDLPHVVFESESLQELYLSTCKLSQINCVGNGNHLKTLHLSNVYVEEETFANIMSSCPLIERFSLSDCKGFRTIQMQNHHNLKSFDLYHNDGSIEIYLPSTIGRITTRSCPWSWFHHRNYFTGLTCLYLEYVSLSDEWFNSFSRNFPCLEELKLWNCDGFDELNLSSRSIKYLNILMFRFTTKATIDAPSIKMFQYKANISQSISFTTTSSSEWNSKIQLSLNELDDSLWFLKLSELVAALNQSQISLVLSHSGRLSDISVCCGSYKPVAVKSLDIYFGGIYYDSFFSDLMNGLFRIMRPREIKQAVWYRTLCTTLQMGRSEDQVMSFWQQDLEEISLEVQGFDVEEWHPVQGTINWSEYVKERYNKLRFRLKWRE